MTIWGTANTAPVRNVTDTRAGLGERIGADAADTFESSPLPSLLRMNELGRALEGEPDLTAAIEGIQRDNRDPAEAIDFAVEKARQIPELPIADARAKVKEEGLEPFLHLPDQDMIRKPALDIMMERAKARKERELTINRGPSGVTPWLLSTGTSFLVGALDPLNIATAFIPVIGEARYAGLLARAGESASRRALVRAGVGGAAGAVGTLPLIGLEAAAKLQEGQDYTMSEALQAMIFNIALAGGIHAGGGLAADVIRSRRGTPVYPFAEGEPRGRVGEPQRQEPPRGVEPAGVEPEADTRPAEIVSGPTEVMLPERASEPITIGQTALEPTPLVRAIEDLPNPVKQDAMRGAIANIVSGEPVRAAEMVNAAAQSDPRVAESLRIAEEPSQEPPGRFVTARGSLYEIMEDGTTVRTKAARKDFGHEGDFGEKPRTEKTVYVSPENAQRLAAPDDVSWRVVDHGDGTLSLATKNPDGKWGSAPSQRNISVSSNPKLGLKPIELWKRETVNGLPAFGKIHLGNEIVSVSPRAAKELNVAGDRNAQFQSLADAQRLEDDPDSIVASETAEKLPEPASFAPDPDARTAAAEKAAAQAEAEYLASESYIHPEVRERVAREIVALDQEVRDRSEVIEKGAACLAAAIGIV